MQSFEEKEASATLLIKNAKQLSEKEEQWERK
jgi:hypothetical protein